MRRASDGIQLAEQTRLETLQRSLRQGSSGAHSASQELPMDTQEIPFIKDTWFP